MICISEPDATNTAAEPVAKGPNPSNGPVRPSFAPRQFLGLSSDGRTKHPHRLSHVLRSIAARTENTVCMPPIVQIPPVVPAAADPVDEAPLDVAALDVAALDVAAMPKLPTPARPQPVGEDRRRFLRRYSKHLVRVLPIQDVSFTPQELDWALHHSPFRGQMKNISMNGVAFLLKKPLDISAGVWLRLECRARDFAVIRSAHVIRAVPVSEAEWIITCRFDRCVPYADVAQLGQELC